jgi:hypothetical protein
MSAGQTRPPHTEDNLFKPPHKPTGLHKFNGQSGQNNKHDLLIPVFFRETGNLDPFQINRVGGQK